MTTMTPVRRERLNTLLVQASKVSVRAILQRRWPRQGQYLQKKVFAGKGDTTKASAHVRAI